MHYHAHMFENGSSQYAHWAVYQHSSGENEDFKAKRESEGKRERA